MNLYGTQRVVEDIELMITETEMSSDGYSQKIVAEGYGIRIEFLNTADLWVGWRAVVGQPLILDGLSFTGV